MKKQSSKPSGDMGTLSETNKMLYIIDEKENILCSGDTSAKQKQHWKKSVGIGADFLEPFYYQCKDSGHDYENIVFFGPQQSQKQASFVFLGTHIGLRIADWVVVDKSDQAKQTEKEELLRFVGHQIQQPMTLLKGYMELFLSEPNKTYQDIIVREIDTMSSLVSHLVQVLKISDEYVAERVCRVQVSDWFEAVKEQQRENLKDYELVVQDHILPDNGVIKAEENLLTEAIDILCANIKKYVPIGTRVELKLLAQKDEINIIVQDLGPGIPQKKKEALFTAFTRGHDDLQGSGLGLYLVQKILQAHQGKIRLGDTQTGTQFVLSLPRA